jgi:hypothetical protein
MSPTTLVITPDIIRQDEYYGSIKR